MTEIFFDLLFPFSVQEIKLRRSIKFRMNCEKICSGKEHWFWRALERTDFCNNVFCQSACIFCLLVMNTDLKTFYKLLQYHNIRTENWLLVWRRPTQINQAEQFTNKKIDFKNVNKKLWKKVSSLFNRVGTCWLHNTAGLGNLQPAKHLNVAREPVFSVLDSYFKVGK